MASALWNVAIFVMFVITRIDITTVQNELAQSPRGRVLQDGDDQGFAQTIDELSVHDFMAAVSGRLNEHGGVLAELQRNGAKVEGRLGEHSALLVAVERNFSVNVPLISDLSAKLSNLGGRVAEHGGALAKLQRSATEMPAASPSLRHKSARPERRRTRSPRRTWCSRIASTGPRTRMRPRPWSSWATSARASPRKPPDQSILCSVLSHVKHGRFDP